jgi:hypothetical protein
MIYSLPEIFKLVDATAGPVTTNGGVTGQYVHARNAQRGFLVLQFTQAVGHATVITIKEAKTIAGGSVQTVANSVQIWSNEATATTDTLVKQTAATTYTLTADVAKKMVVFQLDPALFTVDFCVWGFTVSDSSQATNFVSGFYLLADRFPQATPRSAIA